MQCKVRGRFKTPSQKSKLGDKCPWSVGWYDPQGRRRQKSIGSKSRADKYCRRVEGELTTGVYGDRKRVKWADFPKLVLQGKSRGTANAYVSALEAFERITRPGYRDLVNTSAVDMFAASNANVDNIDAALLQRLVRHQSQQTTRGYTNMAERLKRSGVADRLHVPAFPKTGAG